MGNAQRPRGGAIRVGLVAALSVLLVLAGGAAAVGETGGAGAACKRGGWRQLTDLNGRSFKSQGQCVRAAVHGRLGQPLNPQVTGPFTGTTTVGFECAFFSQEFDATVTTAVGSGVLHVEGCVSSPPPIPLRFDGSFTLTTSTGGTLAGSVSGTIDVPIEGPSRVLDFTLTVTAATGSLSGATGTVHLLGEWQFDTGFADSISGTLTGDLTPT